MRNSLKAAGAALAVLSSISPAWGQDAAALIAQADALYAQRSDPALDKEALSLYEKAIAEAPAKAEAYWKASRAAWWIGTLLKERSERLRYFDRGIRWGKAGLKLLPDSVEAHFWLGGNYASYGDSKGALTSLFLIPQIRREMTEVNRINENYMGGGGDRILGIMDYKVPPIAGGNKARAKQLLEKALSLDPRNPVTIYYLAEFHAVTGDKAAAIEFLDRLRRTASSEEFSAERLLMLKEAASLSKKLSS